MLLGNENFLKAVLENVEGLELIEEKNVKKIKKLRNNLSSFKLKF